MTEWLNFGKSFEWIIFLLLIIFICVFTLTEFIFSSFNSFFHSTVFLLRRLSGSHWPPVSPAAASASGSTEEPGWLSPPTPAVSHRSDSSETNQPRRPTAQLIRGGWGTSLGTMGGKQREHFYLKGHLCHSKFLWMLKDGAIDGEAEWRSHKETIIN